MNMKFNLNNYILVTAILLLPLVTRGQADIHFSQFYETSILRNPALTGVFADDYKFGAYFRNQWSSISHPYQTILISAETRVSVSRTSEDFLSFGVLGFSDKAGSIDQAITTFYPAINYNKSINADHHTYLSVGFTGGYVQYSFDPSKATFNNQYLNGSFSPLNPAIENLPAPKMTFWDIGAGVNFNTSSGEFNNATYILGVSAYHITQPNMSYYKTTDVNENIRWNGNAATGVLLNDQLVMQAQLNFAQQGTYQEIMIGGMAIWSQKEMGPEQLFALSGGCFYRYNDAIIPVVKVKVKNMSFGVSYDVNVSTLKEASNLQGGIEFTAFISGSYGGKNGVLRKTVCPRF